MKNQHKTNTKPTQTELNKIKAVLIALCLEETPLSNPEIKKIIDDFQDEIDEIRRGN
jgi:hypothetical protein